MSLKYLKRFGWPRPIQKTLLECVFTGYAINLRYRDQSYRNSKLEIRYPGSRFVIGTFDQAHESQNILNSNKLFEILDFVIVIIS